jgi:4'-phosphopantetheinyl transferase
VLVPLALEPNEVHLWLTQPARATAAELQDAYRELLSPEERARCERFLFHARRHEYLITRALARTTLSRYGSLPAAALRFRAGPGGRPALDPVGDLDFNLSNSSGLVACAVSRRAVGVDVEPLEHAGAVLGLAEVVLSDRERRTLDALPPARRALRALVTWTLKEAYLKARGAGLGLPLQEVEFTIRDSGAVTATFGRRVADLPERWTFHLLEHAGHSVAVAAEGAVRVRAREVVPLASGQETLVVSDDAPA